MTTSNTEQIQDSAPTQLKETYGECDAVSRLKALHPLLENKYTILESIGHGAQGTVLKARDNNSQLVAIKVFNLSDSDYVTDWKAVDLLKREAETLKSLNIEGIPKFIEFIEGVPKSYLVESYIDAQSLNQRIKDGIRPNEAQVYEIMKQCLIILDNLHNQLTPIIHRDIKPSNILVDLSSNKVKTWLVDFGTVTAQQYKTKSSTVAGTFGYAAPEQFYGKASPASDIYALGMTLVHLITGVAPNDMDMDGLTLKYEKYLPPNMSRELKQLLSYMTKTNPQERPQSASEILEQLTPATHPTQTDDSKVGYADDDFSTPLTPDTHQTQTDDSKVVYADDDFSTPIKVFAVGIVALIGFVLLFSIIKSWLVFLIPPAICIIMAAKNRN